jgi:hypothetical protein
MLGRSIVNGFKTAFIASLLCILLFAHIFPHLPLNCAVHIFYAIIDLLQNPQTQWMVYLCFDIYLIVFISFRGRHASSLWRPSTSHFWLVCCLFIGSISYFFHHSLSSNALVFLGVATIAQGVMVWLSVEDNIKFASNCLILLLILLILASMSHLNLYPYAYRGSVRWSGLWNNPNIAGLLMATGITVAIGFGAKMWQVKQRCSKFGVRENFIATICFLAVALLAYDLLCSYSRGAWLGMMLGAAYLIMKFRGGAEISEIPWLKRNMFCVSSICVFITILCFWHFNLTDSRFAQRAFSIANRNDYSWRNRIAAWNGALQIIAEHSWCGAGWNQPEILYKQYYLPPKLNQEMAIEMNDYLMLGAALGIPALFCFGMYVWLSLTQKSNASIRRLNICASKVECRKLEVELYWLKTTCHAGAIVLAAGFCFDGGLFALPTASMFWILLELGQWYLQFAA